MKSIIRIGTTYCGCPSETIEVEYYDDDDFAQAVLEAIFNSEAPHYYIDVEDDVEDDEDEEECDDDADYR